MSSFWKSKMTTRPSHPTSHITITIPDNVCILTLNVRKAWALITALIMGIISKRVWWLCPWAIPIKLVCLIYMHELVEHICFYYLFFRLIYGVNHNTYVWISQKYFFYKSEMPFYNAALQYLKVKPLAFCFLTIVAICHVILSINPM